MCLVLRETSQDVELHSTTIISSTVSQVKPSDWRILEGPGGPSQASTVTNFSRLLDSSLAQLPLPLRFPCNSDSPATRVSLQLGFPPYPDYSPPDSSVIQLPLDHLKEAYPLAG